MFIDEPRDWAGGKSGSSRKSAQIRTGFWGILGVDSLSVEVGRRSTCVGRVSAIDGARAPTCRYISLCISDGDCAKPGAARRNSSQEDAQMDGRAAKKQRTEPRPRCSAAPLRHCRPHAVALSAFSSCTRPTFLAHLHPPLNVAGSRASLMSRLSGTWPVSPSTAPSASGNMRELPRPFCPQYLATMPKPSETRYCPGRVPWPRHPSDHEFVRKIRPRNVRTWLGIKPRVLLELCDACGASCIPRVCVDVVG